MRLFYPPPFPAARPPPRSYPGGHALFVSHQTIACRCTEGGGGYASWTTNPKWRWCQVASGSSGPAGRTPGIPLPIRNHPRVQRSEGRCRRQRAFDTPLVYPGPTSAHAETAGYTVCKGKRQRTWKAKMRRPVAVPGGSARVFLTYILDSCKRAGGRTRAGF